VLDDIVAELVIKKCFVELLDLVQRETPCRFWAVLQYPLEHSATVRVT
jgi:hypothetical protein